MLRPELTPLPDRIARLPVDDRGYPIPYFVAYVNDKPEFRAMDPRKWVKAVREKRCWVCGDYLGKWLTFVVGPMCGINRTTTEPPCHASCAEWSVVNCPFLARPQARRREDDLTRSCEGNNAGEAIKRNPGVVLLWTTTEYRVFNDGNDKPLIELGPCARHAWVCEGRNATRDEVEASVDTGLPFLAEKCEAEDGELRRMDARRELARRHRDLVAMYPPEEVEVA